MFSSCQHTPPDCTLLYLGENFWIWKQIRNFKLKLKQIISTLKNEQIEIVITEYIKSNLEKLNYP